jgi:hypothetical protein
VLLLTTSYCCYYNAVGNATSAASAVSSAASAVSSAVTAADASTEYYKNQYYSALSIKVCAAYDYYSSYMLCTLCSSRLTYLCAPITTCNTAGERQE